VTAGNPVELTPRQISLRMLATASPAMVIASRSSWAPQTRFSETKSRIRPDFSETRPRSVRQDKECREAPGKRPTCARALLYIVNAYRPPSSLYNVHNGR
jgi:hypothetical protein